MHQIIQTGDLPLLLVDLFQKKRTLFFQQPQLSGGVALLPAAQQLPRQLRATPRSPQRLSLASRLCIHRLISHLHFALLFCLQYTPPILT